MVITWPTEPLTYCQQLQHLELKVDLSALSLQVSYIITLILIDLYYKVIISNSEKKGEQTRGGSRKLFQGGPN